MSKQGRWLSDAVGKILAERRDQLNLTQAEVAKSLRIQRTSISHIESGKQVLLLDVFYDICEKLDISPVVVLDKAILGMSDETTPYEEIEKIVER